MEESGLAQVRETLAAACAGGGAPFVRTREVLGVVDALSIAWFQRHSYIRTAWT